MPKKFGDVLRKFRKVYKVPAAAIADLLGVSRAYIALFEKNKQPAPTYEKCTKIADFLKLTEKEKAEFYQAAFNSRASKDSSKFLKEIKRLLLKRDEPLHQRFLFDKNMKSLPPMIAPVIKPPSQKVLPPYNNLDIIKTISFSELSNENCYAVYAKDVSPKEFFSLDTDVMVIDPTINQYHDNDLLYVKINDYIGVQKYNILPAGNQKLIQFTPYSNKDNILFEPDSSHFQVFGKVALRMSINTDNT